MPNDPAEPGSIPKVETTPGLELGALPRALVFPNNGTRAEIASGPYGPRAGDQPRWEGPPLLGNARFPGQPRTFQVPADAASQLWTPIDVDRPTLMLYVDCNAPATSNLFKPAYMPAIPPSQFDDHMTVAGPVKIALPGWGPHFWLWAPGRWYVTAAYFPSIVGAFVAQYLLLPFEDPNAVAAFLHSLNCQVGGATTAIDVAAGAASTLLTMAEVLRCSAIEVENTGAVNDLRIQFGITAPTATSGLRLQPGEAQLFSGASMPLSWLRMFSAATTVRVTRWFRLPGSQGL